MIIILQVIHRPYYPLEDMWSTEDIHHNTYSMPSFRRVASVCTRVARGVACVTDDILSGAVCTLTTSRGIKTLTHLKRPPGLCGASGGSACRSPSALPSSSSPPLSLSFPILRCSNYPPGFPFPFQRKPPPNCTPDVLLPTTLALSTGSSSQLLPHLDPATLLRVPQTYPASRDSLFFRANGNRTHPSFAFPPSFSPVAPFTLTPLAALPANCFQRFP